MRNRKYFQHNLQIDSHVAGETAKAPHNDEGISHIKAEDPEGSNTEIMAEDVVKESSGHVVDDTSQGNKGKPKEYPQEECPLNCGQSHSGGSCFSCKIFRMGGELFAGMPTYAPHAWWRRVGHTHVSYRNAHGASIPIKYCSVHSQHLRRMLRGRKSRQLDTHQPR